MERSHRWTQIERIDPLGVNQQAQLPYGLKADEVVAAMNDVIELLYDLNLFLVNRGNLRLQEMILGNSFSGIVSEFLVQAVDRASETLVRNSQIGGHPDLVPTDMYANDRVLHGAEGVEVKTSLQSGGWQGHNPEKVWILVFQYSIDILTQPIQDRAPFRFEKAMAALLEESDWSFSGRTGASRRTPTASILKAGTAKLHQNFIYERPGYVRARRRTPGGAPSEQG